MRQSILLLFTIAHLLVISISADNSEAMLAVVENDPSVLDDQYSIESNSNELSSDDPIIQTIQNNEEQTSDSSSSSSSSSSSESESENLCDAKPMVVSIKAKRNLSTESDDEVVEVDVPEPPLE